jgi:hypothetical protein
VGILLDVALFLVREHDAQSAGDASGDFVLDFKDILELTVIAFRPDGMAAARLSKLGGNAQAVAGPADAAIKDVGGRQLLANLGRWKGLVAKREHGGSRKELELLDLCDLCDDVFGHTIAKVFVLLVSTKIREVQHGEQIVPAGGWEHAARRSASSTSSIEAQRCSTDFARQRSISFSHSGEISGSRARRGMCGVRRMA